MTGEDLMGQLKHLKDQANKAVKAYSHTKTFCKKEARCVNCIEYHLIIENKKLQIQSQSVYIVVRVTSILSRLSGYYKTSETEGKEYESTAKRGCSSIDSS